MTENPRHGRPPPPAQPEPATAPGAFTSSDPAGRYLYGRQILALTDQLRGSTSYQDAASLIDQITEPIDGLLDRLADFFEAAGETAQDSETEEGFDLRADFEDAAVTVRTVNEHLHVAAEKLHALGPSAPLRAAYTRPPLQQPSLPPPAPGRSR